MGIKFLQNIDAERNKFEEAGFEVVNALPTTNLFVGRQVMYNGQLYVYNGRRWVNVNAPYEANLQWGGGHFSDGYSPIDAGLIPALGANRIAFLPPENIDVEYSRDGGATWLEYDNIHKYKLSLTSNYNSRLYIGNYIKDNTQPTADYQLRVTINAGTQIYSIIRKIAINYSTKYSQNVILSVSASKRNSTDFTELTNSKLKAFPGYSILNFNAIIIGDLGNYYNKLRLTFTNSGSNGTGGFVLFGVGLYGGVGWYAPSNLAKIGTIYSFDEYANVTFPAAVKSTETVNFDVNIKPTQTGTVAKRSDWLWQYYAQSIAWLMANHLPLAGGTMTGNLTVPKLIKSGGTATQALMADGSTKDISGFASSEDIPTQLPNPNPIIIKTADGVSVRYDGSASRGVILEAGDNAKLTATQDSDDTMTVKFGAVVPTRLANPQALTIQVLDDAGAVIGSDILYDGLIAKILKLVAGYGIELNSVNLTGGQAVAINLKQIAGTTLLGNANGTTGTPQAVTMAQLRTMLGSLMLNDIDVTLGGNSSYTLPCYIDYNGTRYQCRISSDATGLQIYRDGVWRTIGKFCRCSTRGTITNSNIDNWYKDTVSNYELDESVSAALFAEDLTTKFGTSMAGVWTGKTVTLNLASVSIKDTKSAWEMLKKNMDDCFPRKSVEKIRHYYNVAIPSGEVVTKIELSYHNSVGMCTVHFYTEG